MLPLTAAHDGLDSLELPMVRLPKAMLSAKDVKARSSLDEHFCFANLVSPRPPLNVPKNARHHFIVRLGNFKHYQFISDFFVLFPMKTLGK